MTLSFTDLNITYKGFSLGDFISAVHNDDHENTILEAVETLDQFLKNVCILLEESGMRPILDCSENKPFLETSVLFFPNFGNIIA